ncbi:MAG: TipAS antibiotic-recognition domain-containing protein, partial [Anaerolineae bacterium]
MKNCTKGLPRNRWRGTSAKCRPGLTRPANVYRGLGQLYAEHDEFRQYYDRFRPGLADFMKVAM